MTSQNENKVRINTYLSAKDLTVLRKQAQKEGSSVSFIVRRAVKEYIARGDSDVK